MEDTFLDEELAKPDFSIEKIRLTRLLEALDALLKAGEWQELQELHFAGEEDRINRLLLAESKKNLPDLPTIYRLQGELLWARRYKDLRVWAKLLEKQLSTLKKHE